jgi:uncharacterized protein
MKVSAPTNSVQENKNAYSTPLALRQLAAAGNLDNLRLAIRANAATPARADGDGNAYRGRPRQLGPVDPLPGTDYRGPVFMDSDIYKTLEAIGWELAHGPQPDLADHAASIIDLLAQAQQPDGYLNSYIQASGEPPLHEARLEPRTVLRRASHPGRHRPAPRRWRLPAAGHRHPAGRPPGQRVRRPGEGPGRSSHHRDRPCRDVPARPVVGAGRRYLQDHVPVRESVTETGHAVRALYLEAGATDVATETRDHELLDSSVRRWDDMLAAKTYLTGGNGSRHVDEGFGDRFELPPDRAYNETCAAIASFQWSWRLLLATGDAKYADHMERVLYNGFAAAISAEGDRFFYVNPLQRREDHFERDDPGRRRAWFSRACCPPNIMRLLASLSHYLATSADDTLYVH